VSGYSSTLERWQVFVSDAVAAIFSICVLILHLLLCSTFGTNCKNPPEITFEKFVKLSGHTFVCNNLTSFECKVQKTGNGNLVNQLKIALKNS
jgi:hypothetical protein